MTAKSISCRKWKVDRPSSHAALPIATLAVEGGGRIGVCPLPGQHNPLEHDLDTILAWRPALVISMTEAAEMKAAGSALLGERLRSAGVEWVHLPVRDFGGLSRENAGAWPALSRALHDLLDDAKGVLVHCRGGQGRSGMIALRLMVERQEEPEAALKRLRAARSGAVETDEQLAWALQSERSSA